MSRLPVCSSTVILMLALGACAPANSGPADTSADVGAIGKLRADYVAAMNSGDANKLVDLYASDAILMEQHEPAIAGRDAILKHEQELMSQFTPSLTLTGEETKVMGDAAYDRGTYTFVLAPKAAGMPTMTEHGKYLVILTKDAGNWKLSREIGNTSDPMPTMPTPAPAAAPSKKK